MSNQDKQPAKQPGIYAKVLELQKRAKVKKDAKNPHFGYKYASALGVNDGIKDLLSELGIVAQLNVAFVGQVQDKVLVAAAVLTLIDSADGSQLTFSSIGSGTDSGDKHAMKAATAASKYATIAALFGASDDDPEADPTTDAKPALATGAQKASAILGKPVQVPAAGVAAEVPAGTETHAVQIQVAEPKTRTGKQPFKVTTDAGIFQSFDGKLADKVVPGATVVYKTSKFGNDILEVLAGASPEAA